MIKKRIFIAINLSKQIKKQLFDWELKLEQEYKLGEFRGKNINWVIKDNLHITLVFIGYATDDEIYDIAKKMKSVAKKHQPFFINLEKIILGPASSINRPLKSKRMFWVEGEKSQELAKLQNDLEGALNMNDNYQKELYVFNPHITLARFKSSEVVKRIKEQGIVDKKISYQISVDNIELMQSNLSRRGPEYIVLESIELGK
ncbi:MAG TPA: RNA 2',3'-cyclic phosphodiesterase [Candidatus Portnoybacteria bacterium]|jgi:RNA 2',3'-cyclic 3'-phosphodiesterase|nr:RNA 2',3'-cyclic phosphodiesterase [Candidatus Portnoybacteria bacterium]MDD5752196.1 RNA 2',3'-cyclic phosphodiesterase [Candidatus Portnoybacteria bacterium]HOZ16562.1 RNA 2',3'-cyclic phosphodiesterase [Candidatus Portnoybacteria bacterium]HPH52189.1 RNA 2',3'-cyclic phosphodiesterase [Candidatus Portnoybacteria bacterium]HPJ80364.1 RNA 2',3'-cyclic phosphodiesterase [Candidatus Portnoybacteria bacterium]